MTKYSLKKYFVKYKKPKNWNGLAPLILFLVLTIPTGLYLVFNVPAMFAADGGAQVSRAYQVSDGGIKPVFINHEPGVGYGGEIPLNLFELKNVELGIVGQDGNVGIESNDKILTAQDKQQIATISSQKISKEMVEVSYVNTAAYSPLAYVPSVIGLEAGKLLNFSLGHTLQLAGLLGFITFLACAGYSLYTLRRNQLKWAVLTVSLLPLVVFQTTLITADSFLISLVILFSALLIKAFNKSSTLSVLDKVLLFLTIILIPQAKSVYFPLIFLSLLTPKDKWLTKKSYWLFTASALVVSLIGFGIWSSLTTDVAASNGLVRGLPWQYGFAKVQEKFILHNPLGYLHSLIDSLIYETNFYIDTYFGWLGFTYLPVPGTALVAGFIALGLSILLAGEQKVSHYIPIAIAVIDFAIVLITFTTLYIAYTLPKLGYVQGVQGRYFLPITILSIAMFAMFFPKLRIAKNGRASAKVILVILVAFCLVFSIYRYGLAIAT